MRLLMITLLLLLAYSKTSAMDDDQSVQAAITVQYFDKEKVETYTSFSKSAKKLSYTKCTRNKETGKFDGKTKEGFPWAAIPGGDPGTDPEGAMTVCTSYLDPKQAENMFNKLKKTYEQRGRNIKSAKGH